MNPSTNKRHERFSSIGYGKYNHNTTATAILYEEYGSGTATDSPHVSETGLEYYTCYGIPDEEFIDFWEPPWHPPIPWNIKPRKSAPLKTKHIIKQPGSMRRGNRLYR